MTPSIDDIRRDDKLLDELGGRKAPRRGDAATDALGLWVQQIDAPDRPAAAGRYARAKRTPARVGVVAAVTVAALSISGVAAAVGGVPGISRVAEQMGLVHRSADFGSGAGGPVSTDAAVAVPSTTSDAFATSTEDPFSSTGSARSATSAPRRVLPGAVLPSTRHRPGHSAAPSWRTATSVSSGPSSSAPNSTASPSSSSSSSGSSSPTSTGSSSSSGSSTTSTHPTHPTHPPKPPKPSSTSTASPSASSSTPPTLSSTSTSPTAESSTSSAGRSSSDGTSDGR